MEHGAVHRLLTQTADWLLLEALDVFTLFALGAWCVVLLLPPSTFDQGVLYEGMARMADETVWGLAAGALWLAYIAVLVWGQEVGRRRVLLVVAGWWMNIAVMQALAQPIALSPYLHASAAIAALYGYWAVPEDG